MQILSQSGSTCACLTGPLPEIGSACKPGKKKKKKKKKEKGKDSKEGRKDSGGRELYVWQSARKEKMAGGTV